MLKCAMCDNDHFTRRQLAGLAAGASLAALTHARSLNAEAIDEPAATPKDTCPACLDRVPMDRLMAEIIRKQYPDDRLTAGVLESIRHEIRINLVRSRILSLVPLDHCDAPATVFSAWRSDA